MIITTDALNKRIRDNEDNLFLLYGEEDFFIELAVNSIRRKYLEKGFEQMDSTRLDFNNKGVSVEKVVENIELPAWASKKRVVEVVNFEFDKDSTEKLPSIISKIPEGTVLLFVTASFDKRKKKLLDAFGKNGIVCEVKHLDESVLNKFIQSGVSKQGLTITPDACDSIISRYDKSMRQIDSAVKRISMYCSATDTKNIAPKRFLTGDTKCSIASASAVSARMLPMTKAPKAAEKPTTEAKTTMPKHRASAVMSIVSLLISDFTLRRNSGMR